jgi:hypothetical protein
MKTRALLPLLLGGSLLFGGSLIARGDQDPPVNSAYKQTSDPSGYKDEIKGLVDAEIKKLADPASQSDARDWLSSQAILDGDPAKTAPAYMTFYGGIVSSEFADALSKPDTSARVRVNMAIVAGTISQTSKVVTLIPVIETLLTDKSDAVVLLAEKAANNVIPSALSSTTLAKVDLDNFLAAIAKGVTDHPAAPIGGDIAEVAYRALNPIVQGIDVPPAVLKSLADVNLSLQSARLKLYQSASAGIPENPQADTYASSFLLDHQRTWPNLDAKEQLASIQNASDLISMAGQRAAKMPGTNEELIQAINREGKFLQYVEAANFSNPTLDADLVTISKGLSVGSLPEVILESCTKIYPALKDASPMLADLQAPPSLSGAAPSAAADAPTP